MKESTPTQKTETKRGRKRKLNTSCSTVMVKTRKRKSLKNDINEDVVKDSPLIEDVSMDKEENITLDDIDLFLRDIRFNNRRDEEVLQLSKETNHKIS